MRTSVILIMVVAVLLGGCSGMSYTEQRTLSGGAIGAGGGALQALWHYRRGRGRCGDEASRGAVKLFLVGASRPGMSSSPVHLPTAIMKQPKKY